MKSKFSIAPLCSLLLVCSQLLCISGCHDNKSKTPPDVEIQPQLTMLQQLQQLPDVDVEKRSSPIDGYDYYYLQLQQPINHNSPALGTFKQHIRLLLKDNQRPTVLNTKGYGLPGEQQLRLTELATELDANQVEVEHRYFNGSTPENHNWQYLTIEQAAADHNRIIELLSPLLGHKWLATGRSKGGMTATYLKRFYPQAVSGVVAYVAPLSLALWDERFIDYSLSVIKKECSDKYKQFQRQALLRLDEIQEQVQNWATEKNYTTESNGYDLSDRLQAEIALSWIERSSYFQDMGCDSIPAPEDDTQVYVEYLYQGSGFVFLVDEGLIGWLPYHIQAAKELGNFAVPLSHIEDLLTFDVTDFKLNLLGQSMPEFHPEVMQNIYDWAETQASELIMIYGEQDIFTGGAYPITTDPSRDTQLHIAPGLHNISISDLSEAAQDEIYSTITEWLH